MENSGSSHEHEHHQAPAPQASLMSALNPKQTFVIGLVGGFLILCTLGFFIFLSLYVKGNIPQVAVNNPTTDNGTIPPDDAFPVVGNFRPVDEARDHVKGNTKAKVTLIEYSDFECPFCQRFHPTVKQLLEKYGKDIRFVYRHFPLRFHPQAVPAGLASECAAEQGKFWEMHDMLFEKGVVATGSYTQYAKDIGLNTSKFDTCMTQQKYASRIQEDQTDGQNAGVQGTPHTIIIGPNGEKIPVSGAQPFEAVEAALQQVL